MLGNSLRDYLSSGLGGGWKLATCNNCIHLPSLLIHFHHNRGTNRSWEARLIRSHSQTAGLIRHQDRTAGHGRKMFSGRLSVDTTLLLLYCRGSVGRVGLCCPVDAAWSKFSICQNFAWIEGHDSCCPETFHCHFPGTAFISHRPQGQPQSA